MTKQNTLRSFAERGAKAQAAVNEIIANAEAIKRLEHLAVLIEQTIQRVRRKRGMRPSEKAMTIANYAQDVQALRRGIAAIKSVEGI